MAARFWPSLFKVRTKRAAYWMVYAAADKVMRWSWNCYIAAERGTPNE